MKFRGYDEGLFFRLLFAESIPYHKTIILPAQELTGVII